jgi:hypothetical protein
MTETQPSDAVKNLVRFIIGSAILGMIIARMMYFSEILPVHQVLPPVPVNGAVHPQVTDAVT